jgi:hypothetical protein
MSLPTQQSILGLPIPQSFSVVGRPRKMLSEEDMLRAKQEKDRKKQEKDLAIAKVERNGTIATIVNFCNKHIADLIERDTIMVQLDKLKNYVDSAKVKKDIINKTQLNKTILSIVFGVQS